MPRIKEQALKAELAKRGFESVSIKRELPGGRIQVEANKLYPVHVEGGESIYAPVPVSLSVELDARGRVKSIAGGTPTPAAVTDAARYIKTLRDSGQLTSMYGPAARCKRTFIELADVPSCVNVSGL